MLWEEIVWYELFREYGISQDMLDHRSSLVTSSTKNSDDLGHDDAWWGMLAGVGDRMFEDEVCFEDEFPR